METITNAVMRFDYQTMVPLAAKYGTKVLLALVIFVVGKWIARKVVLALRQLMRKSKVDATLISFGGNMVYTLFMIFVVIAALGQLGVQTTSLAAMIAAAGLAIGMALQGSLSNVASGVMLIVFRPFKVGDYVEAGGTAGTIEEITIFTTQMKTVDNKAITVPNAAITGGIITNFSAKKTRRLDMTVTVSYRDDLSKVKAVLHDMLQKEARILETPSPMVAVSELADEGVRLVLQPWVNTADYMDVKFALLEGIKQRFEAEKISLPNPQPAMVIGHGSALEAA
jgi:small conductance mechanosensitive channel